MYALIFIIPIIIAILAFYPSVGNPDTYSIWDLVNKGIYGDWHPFIYTILFVKIPSIFSNNIYSTLFPQIIFEFITLMYLCYFIRKKYLSFWQTTLILTLLCLNPIFIRFSVYVSKDIPFMCCILLVTLYLINIIDSDTDWLKKWKNKILFILANLGILMLRHNGLVAFIVLFIFMIIFCKEIRKFLIVTFSLIIITYSILTGPIYNKYLDFRNGGKYEAIGVIMGNILYYYNNDVEFLKEDEEILYSIYPKEMWIDYYNPRNFNNLKWSSDDPNFTSRIEDKFDNILKIWWKYTKKEPDIFLKSYLNMTSPIWEISEELNGYNSYPWVGPLSINELNNNLRSFLDSYHSFLENSIFRFFVISFGGGLFIIVISFFLTISKMKLKLKFLMPFIPAMVNVLTIMVLITGEEYRFLLPQLICYIPLFFYSLQKR